MYKKLSIIAGCLAAALAVSVPAAQASSQHGSGPQLRYEADNGQIWQLSNKPVCLPGPDAGYADTGIVVSIGPAGHFNGITDRGSANLSANIWIGDGPEAYTPGIHLLSNPVGFDYGFRQANGSYYMTDGTYAGQDLTPAQIRSDFSGYQAYAWVGITSNGGDASGYVTSVNGRGTGFRRLSITLTEGVTIPSAR